MLSAPTHEERMMLEWSLPMWNGLGPWARKKDGESDEEKGKMNFGHWRGLVSQRERWERRERHYQQSDLISPFDVGEPLDGPPLHRHHLNLPLNSGRSRGSRRISAHRIRRYLPKAARSVRLHDFLSLARACSDFWHYPLPSNIWATLVIDDVRRWKVTTFSRWRANPSGVGSALHLSNALEASFFLPILQALRVSQEEEAEWKAKDVWAWWRFGTGWRNRRRVWYCVVHGCATARDADWW
ncbi:hypothetical protein IAR50_004340 [Cryptococcus sp. DSM 104548]